MAEVGEATVRITADTTYFEQALDRTLLVLFIHALRELAFVKLMIRSKQAAFEFDEAMQEVDDLIKLTPEELHKSADWLEQSLAKEAGEPTQRGMNSDN